MPTVVNGTGTWYYGKRRIHRRKGTCTFCHRVAELESYDTTLYFVVFFVPLLPLGRKRILEQCPACQRHRVTSLAKWETQKEQDTARVLDKLRENPDDRDHILAALGLSVAYQDEALFDKLAPALAGHRLDDADIQANLGAAYSYFVRWPEAEKAYRAALAVRDDPELRERLALVLMKQHRPEEAAAYLQHILEERVRDKAGQVFVLVEAYQAEGMHREALELMDRRDAAFPEMVYLKEYKKQRKTSERYLNSGKKVPSPLLSESGKTGYREGGWTANVPRLVGPLLLLALLGLYLGSAVWIGQARKVYLVNGAGRAYTVAVNGQARTLPPGVPQEVRLPEGDVTIEGRDPKVPVEATTVRIESPFFSRPFVKHTFVLNPDRLAVLVWEEEVYSETPMPVADPHYYLGQPSYAFHGIDYEFSLFPPSLQASKGHTLTKTRVGQVANVSALERVRLMREALDEAQRVDYARRWLEHDPNDVVFLAGVAGQLPPEQTLALLRPHLADRPVLVEWHRAYQHLMERTHPEADLRPEYQKLVDETKGSADAVYLLARLQDDPDEADRLLGQAAEANPPSARALAALGFHALGEGRFTDAVPRLQKAFQLLPNDPTVRDEYWSALLAAGEYDRLLEELRGREQIPDEHFPVLIERVRVYAKKGDKAQARAAIEEAVRPLQGPQEQFRKIVQSGLEMVLCCCENDVKGFLQHAAEIPGAPAFERALLEGKLEEATQVAGTRHAESGATEAGLLYLAARKAGNPKVADAAWQQLLDSLAKQDRYGRRLGDMLAGRKPFDPKAVVRLPLEPKEKRVLLAVAARRFPKQGKDLLALAGKLNFYDDVTTLCLRNVLE